jgi:hypothetical protein
VSVSGNLSPVSKDLRNDACPSSAERLLLELIASEDALVELSDRNAERRETWGEPSSVSGT